jgi:hypothetical protein
MLQFPGAASLNTLIEKEPDFPTNIEIFPPEASWNETKFGNYWTSNIRRARMEKWVALVEDMHKNGI